MSCACDVYGPTVGSQAFPVLMLIVLDNRQPGYSTGSCACDVYDLTVETQAFLVFMLPVLRDWQMSHSVYALHRELCL